MVIKPLAYNQNPTSMSRNGLHKPYSYYFQSMLYFS
nr:MAG TPA: hypothetical protein [Bacteriophage sp.]